MTEPAESKGYFVRLLALFPLICLINFSSVEARTVYHKWEVKYEYKSPDCYKKLVITINGRSPGPTIFAQQGDTVFVELKNSLWTENVAVHWHGIRQLGTPWSDGAEGVTQCPILPGETFIYRFVEDRLSSAAQIQYFSCQYNNTFILHSYYQYEYDPRSQAGTYLYHGHYGMQRAAGLYGSIIASLPERVSEPFSYDYDQNIILNDWYHASTNEQAAGLSAIPFVFVGEPQSLLINGRGKYNCSLSTASGSAAGVCNATNPECSPSSLTVVPGKTYRLRIGSLTSLSALTFEIEGHDMTVVEADGNYVEPLAIRYLYIYSGETYSVLVKADQESSRNYWATINVVARNPATPTGLAIFNYYPNHPQNQPPTAPATGPLWNDTASRLAQSLAFRARQGFIYKPPVTADRVIVLLNTQNKIDGHFKWSLNNLSLILPQTPYLVALKENLTGAFAQDPPPDGYDVANYDIHSLAENVNATSSNRIYRLRFNSTVDVILQNANSMTVKNSETHPWHLHGHDFWVLGYGTGKYNISCDWRKYNLVNPIMKNTAPLHPYGWTALRFRADNPGVWAFHCHVESHFYMGMGVVFEEGIEKVGELPSSIRGCGESEGHHRP